MTTFKSQQIIIEKLEYLDYQYLIGLPLLYPRSLTRFGIEATRLVKYPSGSEFHIADRIPNSSVGFFGCTGRLRRHVFTNPYTFSIGLRSGL